MAVPKKKQSHGRTRRRRAGHKKPQAVALVRCSNCNELIPPHRMCNNCGHYNKKQIVDVTAKLEKKEKKRKEAELKEAEKNKPLDAKSLSQKK